MERDPDRDPSPDEPARDRTVMGRRRFAALAASLSVPLAGCGGESGDSTDTRPPTRTPDRTAADGTATATPTAVQETPTASDAPTDTESATPTDTAEPTPTETRTPVTDGRYGDPDDPVAGPVGLETVAEGLSAPIDVVFVPESDLRYIVTWPGAIRVHGPDGLREEPLLDLSDEIVLGGERGLLGAEPHPEFADNGRLFVRYSAPRRAGTPEEYSHTFVVAEFEVDRDRHRADLASERTIIEIPEPHDNHNAGDLAFGPDGYLHVPTGDGGNQFDVGPFRPDDWYEFNEGGNGQDTSEFLLGGVLRIDVGERDEPGYTVPPDNPLVDMPGHRDEYYAWGLRNPFRLSFDGDDLFVGNVGEHQWESVALVERGGNYGWNVREGSHCFDASDEYHIPESCPTRTPPDVRGGEPIRDPILEYVNARNQHLDPANHLSGVAVTGGYVYRGSAIPELAGRYLFADLAHQGRLFVGTPPDDGDGEWSLGHVNLTADAAERLGNVWSFGRDDAGEVYVVAGEKVHRVVPA